MSTNDTRPSFETETNPVSRYVDDHPFVVGYLVFEAVLLVLAFVLDRPADVPTSIVQESAILNVLSGLLGAFAVMLGIIGLLLIASLWLWAFLASGR